MKEASQVVKFFSIRLTTAEAKALQQIATDIGYGVTVSAVIREAIRRLIKDKQKG